MLRLIVHAVVSKGTLKEEHLSQVLSLMRRVFTMSGGLWKMKKALQELKGASCSSTSSLSELTCHRSEDLCFASAELWTSPFMSQFQMNALQEDIKGLANRIMTQSFILSPSYEASGVCSSACTGRVCPSGKDVYKGARERQLHITSKLNSKFLIRDKSCHNQPLGCCKQFVIIQM